MTAENRKTCIGSDQLLDLLPAIWHPAMEGIPETVLSSLQEKVESAYAAAENGTGAPVYPEYWDIFAAFRWLDPQDVKVVIIGQDPYHERGQAHGLAFSTLGIVIPRSLRNIFSELSEDIGIPVQNIRSGDLTPWREEGVLLLNTILTVEEGKADSHRDFGWESVTKSLLRYVLNQQRPVCVILWGAHAQKMFADASVGLNLLHIGVFMSTHPSPLSARRGFFGSRPFSRCNRFLSEHSIEPVDWSCICN